MTEIKVKVIGSGTVSQYSVGGGRYIQLKAIPDYGAKFIRWEKFDQLPGCSPTFSSANLCNINTRYTGDVVAVFSEKNKEETQLLESTLQLEDSELKNGDFMMKQHTIILKNTESDGGVITMNPQKEKFSFGEKVSLEAVANDDSSFKAWEIRVNGLLIRDERLNEQAEISIALAKCEERVYSINAIFDSLFAEKEADPNEFIRAVLETTYAKPVGRNEQYTYVLKLFNLKDFPINIKVPLTDKVIDDVKKVPQKKWGGSINGVKGITLDANGFCEIFLVYLEKWSLDEVIGVAVELTNLEINLTLKFRAPKKGLLSNKKYRLVDCQLKGMEGKSVSKTSNRELIRLLDRVDALETSLANALTRLDLLEQHPSVNRISTSSDDQLTLNSLDDVMDWLLEAETVALSDLRAHLLPLNLLTGAVIADFNEKAIEQTGELALDEDGENVIVKRAILQKVLGKI